MRFMTGLNVDKIFSVSQVSPVESDPCCLDVVVVQVKTVCLIFLLFLEIILKSQKT